MNKKELEKYISKINSNKSKKFSIKKLFSKLMVCIVLFLLVSIFYKSNTSFNNFVNKHFYNNTFNFTKVKNLYNKYLGGIFPLDKVTNTTEVVFNEKLKYSSFSKYKDGVKLDVDDNYLVPNVSSGLVVFIGEKEGYGNVIIVKTEDDIDIWYGNINNSVVKLYDYVEKGSFLGEAKGNYLYLVYCQDGKFLDYEKMLN